MITRHDVAKKLSEYLRNRMKLEELVAWAEDMMMEEEFDPHDFETLRSIVSRIAVADVREFGLSWEDCHDFLSLLGYRAKVEVSAID